MHMNDDYICQICAVIKTDHSEWRPDVTGNKSAGNVCESCMKVHNETKLVGEELRARVGFGRRSSVRQFERRQEQPMSLHEHCRRESGLTGTALERYITRYYSNR